MSNYAGYKPEDNIRRKANNTGDVIETIGQNKNVKSWSSKPGQMTSSQQAQRLAEVARKVSERMPVKIFTDEEKAKLEEEMGLIPKPQPVVIEMIGPTRILEERMDVKAQIEHLESLGFTPIQIIAILKMAA